MAIRSKNAHDALQNITPLHWQATARKSGVAGVWEAMRFMADRVEPALTALQARLPADFPASTAEAVFEGVRTQLERWQQGVEVLDGR